MEEENLEEINDISLEEDYEDLSFTVIKGDELKILVHNNDKSVKELNLIEDNIDFQKTYIIRQNKVFEELT